MAVKYEVTSVAVNPAEDRAHRMRLYFTAMTIRVACVASLFFVRGWWVLLVGAGAVILPYLAVIVANAAANGQGSRPDAPPPLELEAPRAEADPAAQTVIVVDAPAERRGSGSTA